MTEAAFHIGIFTDNATTVQRALQLWRTMSPSTVLMEYDLGDHILGPRAVWAALDGSVESPDEAAGRLAVIMVQRSAPAFCT